MSSSLFRRLIAAALALVVLTLLAINYVLGSFAAHAGTPVDPDIRSAVLVISLFAAILALAVAFSVSRALTSRVRRLKRAAEGLLGAEAQPGGLSDPNDDLGSLERSLTGVSHELRGLVSNLRFVLTQSRAFPNRISSPGWRRTPRAPGGTTIVRPPRDTTVPCSLPSSYTR